MLPERERDVEADSISTLQREVLRKYASNKGLTFCDLTDGFQKRVREGTRGLFGRSDGMHWSRTGQKVAAEVIVECLGVL